MVSACGRPVPCVEHRIPPAKAATCHIFAGTNNKVVCLHRCSQTGDMRLIPGLGAAGPRCFVSLCSLV